VSDIDIFPPKKKDLSPELYTTGVKMWVYSIQEVWTVECNCSEKT
jgi:hypothetical protein